MSIFKSLLKRTEEDRSSQANQDFLPDLYSGMKVEVLTPANALIFVGKLRVLGRDLLELRAEAGGYLPRALYNQPVKLRVFQRDGSAFTLNGIVSQNSFDFWRVEKLKYLQNSENRSFFRQNTGVSGWVYPITSSKGQKFSCKVLDVSAGGVLIRCQEGSIYYDAVEAIGASAQSVAFSELYSALQSGVVDGAEQPLSGFVNNAFQEVSDYYVLDQHETSPNLILFSEVTWNQMGEEDQQMIRESLEESVPFFEELSDSKDQEYLKTIEESGTEVIEVNVADWQAACSSVYDKYGSEYADIIEQIKNTKD